MADFLVDGTGAGGVGGAEDDEVAGVFEGVADVLPVVGVIDLEVGFVAVDGSEVMGVVRPFFLGDELDGEAEPFETALEPAGDLAVLAGVADEDEMGVGPLP